MTDSSGYSKFLAGTNEVLEAAISIVETSRESNVYISGPFIKPMTELLLTMLNEKGFNSNSNIYMIVPSMSGKDYAGTSFLYYVNLLSKRIRINSRAVHNILAGRDEMLHISYHSKKFGEYTITGAWLKDVQQAEKAVNYCLELWKNSLPLHFEEK